MKTRHGFVSNSSSSSFVCFGAYVNLDMEGDEIADKIDGSEDLVFHPSEDGNVVGVSVSSMGLDETLRQFQTRISEKMKKAGFDVKAEDIRFIGGQEYN